MVLAAEVTFAAAITLTKLSMLMLVRRLLVNASLLWRRVTLAAIVIVTIQGIVFCLTVIFQCRYVKCFRPAIKYLPRKITCPKDGTSQDETTVKTY